MHKYPAALIRISSPPMKPRMSPHQPNQANATAAAMSDTAATTDTIPLRRTVLDTATTSRVNTKTAPGPLVLLTVTPPDRSPSAYVAAARTNETGQTGPQYRRVE